MRHLWPVFEDFHLFALISCSCTYASISGETEARKYPMSPRGAVVAGAKVLTAVRVVCQFRCAGKTGNWVAPCENDSYPSIPGLDGCAVLSRPVRTTKGAIELTFSVVLKWVKVSTQSVRGANCDSLLFFYADCHLPCPCFDRIGKERRLLSNRMASVFPSLRLAPFSGVHDSAIGYKIPEQSGGGFFLFLAPQRDRSIIFAVLQAESGTDCHQVKIKYLRDHMLPVFWNLQVFCLFNRVHFIVIVYYLKIVHSSEKVFILMKNI